MTTLLVVDDSPIDRRLAGGLLSKRADWTIIYAADGEEAMHKVRQFQPSLVLTDMQMPHRNGLDVVTDIRQTASHIPVILMTAMGSEELAVQALNRGAASYVPKRSMVSNLLETVSRVLASSHDEKSHTSLMNRLGERNETFVLENDLGLVMSLARYLPREMAHVWNFDNTDRVRAGTALEEALLNSLYHGNLEVSSKLKEDDNDAFHKLASERMSLSPFQDRRIYVRFSLTPLIANFTIRDDGQGFDHSKLPDPTDPANLELPSGRGVLLMRAFMDEVKYNATGNEVTLTRRRFKT